jgi:hypothetical protein
MGCNGFLLLPQMAATGLLPNVLGANWSYLFLQTFEGHITLSPPFRISDYWNLLADPTYEQVCTRRPAWPSRAQPTSRRGA